MKKIGGIAIALLFVGFILGFGVGYWYVSEYAPTVVYRTQYVQAPSAPEIVYSWDNSTYNFTTAVDANGSVATDTSITNNVTITNDDDTKTISNPKLILYDPTTNKQGLNDALEKEALEVDLVIGSTVYPIFKDGEYVSVNNAPTLSSLTPGASTTITVQITMEQSTEQFKDATTYTCYLYFYEPEYQNAQKITFTLTT